jgi:5-formyltetrahydrofolate cyclo-ligase
MDTLKKFERIKWKNTLQQIGKSRRIEASLQAQKTLLPKTAPYTHILSFANLDDECDISAINEYLCREKKLILPKVVGKKLVLYWVDNVCNLLPNRYNIFEPDPALCRECPPDKIELAFIPALAFDHNFHRLGYGGGFYDRLLPLFAGNVITIGVGFKEQLTQKLPIDPWDHPLSELMLF